MTESLWVILPVKALVSAKQRLAGVLTSQERQGLFGAMLRDTLGSVSGHPAVAGILLVSDDPLAQSLAQEYGAECLMEQTLGVQGLNAVLQSAVQCLAQQNIDRVLILHGDLPFLQGSDIDAQIDAYRALPKPALVIAPDRHGQGTNGLLFDPRQSLPLAYGTDSFQRHRQAGAACGLNITSVHRSSLGRDIDLPEDLSYLVDAVEHAGARHSRDFLCSSGIASRLGQATNDHQLPKAETDSAEAGSAHATPSYLT